MTGAIPPYGEHFRLEQLPSYDPQLSSSRYVLKIDSRWTIRSDRTRKRWHIYYQRIVISPVQPSLTKAMILLREGIDKGFYQVTAAV
jgi:hypothetical protein